MNPYKLLFALMIWILPQASFAQDRDGQGGGRNRGRPSLVTKTGASGFSIATTSIENNDMLPSNVTLKQNLTRWIGSRLINSTEISAHFVKPDLKGYQSVFLGRSLGSPCLETTLLRGWCSSSHPA